MRPILTDRVAWSVGLSFGLSVYRSDCHTNDPCKNGCTDRAAVWVEDLNVDIADTLHLRDVAMATFLAFYMVHIGAT